MRYLIILLFLALPLMAQDTTDVKKNIEKQFAELTAEDEKLALLEMELKAKLYDILIERQTILKKKIKLQEDYKKLEK
jgi:hypothetical protein